MLTKQPQRPICKNCKTVPAKSNGISIHGFKKWHKYCVDCAKAAYDPQFSYLLHKKNKCDKCKFISEDKCQLAIIYKDGDKTNKTPINLITICANCNCLYKKRLKKKSILNITTDSDVGIGQL
jgi:hypothetical protein